MESEDEPPLLQELLRECMRRGLIEGWELDETGKFIITEASITYYGLNPSEARRLAEMLLKGGEEP